MCEELCFRILACSMYWVINSDLSCHVIRTSHSFRSNGKERYLLTDKQENSSFSTNCSSSAMIKMSRCKTSLCVPCVSPSKPTIHRQEDTTQLALNHSRLLVAAAGLKDERIELRKIDLYTKLVTRYADFAPQSIYGLAYIKSQRRIIILLPLSVVSAPVDGGGYTVLKENIECIDVTVDDENNLILLSTKSPILGVGTMHVDGHGYKHIKTSRKVISITVDMKEKTLFRCTYQKIYSATYEGEKLKVLEVGRQMHAMTLDTVERALYYNYGNILMKRLLSKQRASKLVELPALPWRCLFYRNYIYVTYSNRVGRNKRGVSVFTENQPLKKIVNLYKGSVTKVSLCTIP